MDAQTLELKTPYLKTGNLFVIRNLLNDLNEVNRLNGLNVWNSP
jgi:hypothetical protein